MEEMRGASTPASYDRSSGHLAKRLQGILFRLFLPWSCQPSKLVQAVGNWLQDLDRVTSTKDESQAPASLSSARRTLVSCAILIILFLPFFQARFLCHGSIRPVANLRLRY
jgi:hypothetical protein